MHGRGYVNNGDKNAANYLVNEFKKLGVKPFGSDYLQKFDLSVNTFPERVDVKIEKKTLTPSVDYYVAPHSTAINGKFRAVLLNKSIISDSIKRKNFFKKDFTDLVVIIDGKDVKDTNQLNFIKLIKEHNPLKAKAIVVIKDDKLSWHISPNVSDYALIDVQRNCFPKKVGKIKKVTFDIQNKYYENYTTQNICGYVVGNVYPDSFIVFCAHYDHLGRMGKDIYIPGANDNASGIAMMLNLAKYYTIENHRPDYSIAFIFFSAEELGLLGSSYYIEHPLFPLSQISFLVNLDLVGTGDDGIKVVNGSVFRYYFEKLVLINEEHQYLKAIEERGEAKNSDHWPFYEKGVKSFFIYTLGGISEYHNIYDKAETLPLTEFEDLFRLLTDFVETF